jgi:oligosaccharide repeat unit polymerase
MLNYLFLAFMILLWLLIFKIFKNDFCSPSVIFATGFFISSFVFVINTTTWDYVLHCNTIVIICSSVVTVFLGELFARATSTKSIRNTINFQSECKSNQMLAVFCFKRSTIFFLGILIAIFIVAQLRDINYIKSLYGQGDYFLDSYRQLKGYTSLGVYGKVMDVVALSVGYISILAYSNGLIHKRRCNTRYLILLVLCIIYFALSSNRMTIIYFFLSFLILWLIQNAYINRWKYISKESFNKMLKTAGLLVLMFLLLGNLTGKTQSQDSLFQIVSTYVGSAIPAFDIWFQNFNYDISNFGERTLIGITNLFNYVGIDIVLTGERNLPFVASGKMKTNIYTGLRALINDYNYLGMYMILFFEGAIFYRLYLRCKRDLSKGRFTFVLLYAYIITLFALTSIAERIIVTLFTITTVLFVIITIWFIKKVERRSQNITSKKPLKGTMKQYEN